MERAVVSSNSTNNKEKIPENCISWQSVANINNFDDDSMYQTKEKSKLSDMAVNIGNIECVKTEQCALNTEEDFSSIRKVFVSEKSQLGVKKPVDIDMQFEDLGFDEQGKKQFKCYLCNSIIENVVLHKAKHLAISYQAEDKKHLLKNYNSNAISNSESIQRFICSKCNKVFKSFHSLQKHVNLCCKDVQTTCQICGEKFRNLVLMKKHETSHVMIFKCHKCGKSLKSAEQLQKHLKLHGEVILSCQCGEKFDSYEDFQSHSETKHKMKGFRCRLCREVFDKTNDFEAHRMSHERQDWPFTCVVCKKKFLNKLICQVHEKNIHKVFHPHLHDVNDKTCPVCLKTFKTVFTLKSHLAVHGELEHECPHCEKKFSHEKYLLGHVKEVHKERSFICKVCNKSFKHSRHLNDHLKTHTKPYNCEGCGKSFALEKSLKRHQESVCKMTTELSCLTSKITSKDDTKHLVAEKLETDTNHPFAFQNNKVYNCELCTAVFETEELLMEHENNACLMEEILCNICMLKFTPRVYKKHMFEVHLVGEVIKCRFCVRIFYSNDDVASHEEVIHKNECHLCGKVFSGINKLRGHFRSVHVNKTFQCIHCGKKFKSEQSLAYHKNTHTKPFVCLCGAKFALERSLKKHERKHLAVKQAGNIVSEELFVPIEAGEKIFECNICIILFSSLELLETHEINVHSKNSLKCPICESSFVTDRILKKHCFEFHDIGNKSPCTVCPRVFYHKDDLSMHEVFTHKKQCPHCGKIFQQRESLASHIQKLHNIVPTFECSLCEKMFAKQKELKDHTNIHSKIFVCPSCKKRHSTDISLEEHRINCSAKKDGIEISVVDYFSSHNDSEHSDNQNSKVKRYLENASKIYNCELCYMVFDSEDALTAHEIKKHNHGEKPTCSFCNIKFVTIRTLVKHEYESHKIGKALKCEECPRNFYCLKTLEEHVKYVHKKLCCPSCNKEFEDYARLQAHINSVHGERKFKCDNCERKFKSLQHLKEHINTHTKPYMCQTCGARFSIRALLRRHLQFHSKKINSYSCTVCDLNFKTHINLQTHLREAHTESNENASKEKTGHQHLPDRIVDMKVSQASSTVSNTDISAVSITSTSALPDTYKQLLESFSKPNTN